jgi:hypothetical protein
VLKRVYEQVRLPPEWQLAEALPYRFVRMRPKSNGDDG